jgi:hypothetical protein
MRYFPIAILVLLLVSACEKEPQFNTGPVTEPPVASKTFPNVDSLLWPYFERFEIEASARGVEVDLTEVVGTLANISGNGVAGDCQYNPNHPNRLRVDLDTWNQVGENLREYIVFHELGHCERLRKHREDADDNNVCISIMASGVGGCRENYNASTRAEHLDELFDLQFYNDWQP